MTQTLKNALLILGGACCLYCANDALDRDGDGAVPDASGADPAACCEAEPVEAPTIIYDGMIGDVVDPQYGCVVGPEWNISGFRTVVIHQPSGSTSFEEILVKHGSAGYMRLQAPNQGRVDVLGGNVQMIDTRFGTSMRLFNPACQMVNVTVVGYANR